VEAINTPLKVFLFYLSVSIILQILYFEISFLIRKKDYKPKLLESFVVGLCIGIGLVIYWLNFGGGGEGAIAFIVFSPIFVSFFVVTGLLIGLIYKTIKRSLLKIFS
jgi:hypothetical protein